MNQPTKHDVLKNFQIFIPTNRLKMRAALALTLYPD
jgi:hypothetical protein